MSIKAIITILLAAGSSKNLENRINSDVLYTYQIDFLYWRVDFD